MTTEETRNMTMNDFRRLTPVEKAEVLSDYMAYIRRRPRHGSRNVEECLRRSVASLEAKFGITDENRAHWEAVAERMKRPQRRKMQQ